MFCDKCGTELSDNDSFCSKCGNKIKIKKRKNIYLALIFTFFITGLGSIYAGNVKKGLILLVLRFGFAFLSGLTYIFFILSVLVWVYGFYEVYKDIQIANGHDNPKLLNDFKNLDKGNKTIAVLIIVVILIFAVTGIMGSFLLNTYSGSDTHYSTSDVDSSSGSHSSSSSSHYGGVDTSPSSRFIREDSDWYYDHYEYGDNPDVDDYLESEGFD